MQRLLDRHARHALKVDCARLMLHAEHARRQDAQLARTQHAPHLLTPCRFELSSLIPAAAEADCLATRIHYVNIQSVMAAAPRGQHAQLHQSGFTNTALQRLTLCRLPLAVLVAARSSHWSERASFCSPICFFYYGTHANAVLHSTPTPGSSMLGVHLPEPGLRQPGVQRRMSIPLAEALLQDGWPAQVDALPDALPRASVRLIWRLHRTFLTQQLMASSQTGVVGGCIRALTASAPCCISLQLCSPMMGSSCSACLLSDTPTLSAWALPFIFLLCCAVSTRP